MTEAAPQASAETETAKPVVIEAYKAHDADFRCRGFQFEVGKTYTVGGEIEACANGFHACENPMDVWDYYPLVQNDGKLTRYSKVEQSGAIARDGNKVASATIAINAELRLPEIIRAAIDWALRPCKGDGSTQAASGYGSTQAASGYGSTQEITGKNGVIAAAGRDGRARGVDGTWISLAEYDAEGKCIGFATGKIGADGLKPDTWYRAAGGKLVEA